MMFTAAFATLAVSAAAVSGAAIQSRETGSGTYYDVSVGYTSCGGLYTNDQYVVAVSAPLFDSTAIDGNPNHNTICGRQITIDGPSANGPVTATIVDRCQACAQNDIDMTSSLFQNVVGDLSLGRADVTWSFL